MACSASLATAPDYKEIHLDSQTLRCKMPVHLSPQHMEAHETALVRKIDRRLLPILILMFILNYIDRNALPQARRQGLEYDLALEGNQYNTVLSLTFVGYIVGQVPSNMIMSNIKRPSLYLCATMVAWGVVSGASGATQTFGGLASCRFLLGLCEAPFFPGVAFLFSGWYTRKEIGKRLGLFFCGSMVAGAFGGLLSAGISAAFKDAQIASWRMMFLIEGSATALCAFSIAFIIPDWPSTTSWLSEEEKALARLRLNEEAGDADNNNVTTYHALKLAVCDCRVWLCIVGQVSMQAVASLTNFLPTLVAEFGHSEVVTLLLTAPPYAAAAVYSVVACICSDRWSKRSPFIIYPTLVAMAGIVMMLATSGASIRYAALFLLLPGTYGCFQISNAWMANIAARPAKKRGIALALNNCVGNSALVWTPYLYDARLGPRFTLAWSVNLGLLVVLLATTIGLSTTLRRANQHVMGTKSEGDVLVEDQRRRKEKCWSGAWWRLGKDEEVASRAAGKGKPSVSRYDI